MPRGILDRVLIRKSSLTKRARTDSSYDDSASPRLWKGAELSLNSTQFKILKISAICAITLVVLVVCGLGLEMLQVVMIRNDLQKAVDAGALAGACSVEIDATKATNDALSSAARNSANGEPVSMKSKETNVNVQIIRTPSGISVIGVTAKVRVRHFLQGIFGHPSEDVAVTSYAGPVGTVTRVDQGRVFPLAMNIDQLAVPKGLNPSAPMTFNLRLGGKAASFVTFKEDNKKGDSLKKLIAVAMKGGSGAEKTIPAVNVGDTLYISRNSTAGQTQLATSEAIKLLTGKTILLPVVSAGRRKTKVQVLGFIRGKVQNVRCSRRVVDFISLRIVKATNGATSGSLKSSGNIQSDRALKELSAASVKLVSLPAEQSHPVAVTSAARSKPLPNKNKGNAKMADHAEASAPGFKPGNGEALKTASATSARKTTPHIAVADSVAAVVKDNLPGLSKPSRDGAEHASVKVSEKIVKGKETSIDNVATVDVGRPTARGVQKDIAQSPETTTSAADGTPRIGANQARSKSSEELQEASSNEKTQASPTGEKNGAPAKTKVGIVTPTKVEKNVAKSTVVASIAASGTQQTADKLVQAKTPSEKSIEAFASSTNSKTQTQVKAISAQSTTSAKSSTTAEPPEKIENLPGKSKIPEKTAEQVSASSPVLPRKTGEQSEIQETGTANDAIHAEQNSKEAQSKLSMTKADRPGSSAKGSTRPASDKSKESVDSIAESAPAETNDAVDAPAPNVGTVAGPTTVNQTTEDDIPSLDNTSLSKPVSFKVGMYECMLLIGGLLLSLALVWAHRISKQRGTEGDRLRKTFKPLKAQEYSDNGGKGTLIVAPATLRASRGKSMQRWGLKKDTNAESEEGKEN